MNVTVLVSNALAARDLALWERLMQVWEMDTGEISAQILVPTPERAEYVQFQAMAQVGGRCWLPRVDTFESFLRRQAGMEASPSRWVSEEVRLILIRSLLSELAADRFPYPTRETARRFLAAVEALADVPTEEVAPDAELTDRTTPDRSLVARLAQEYEQQLREHGLRDWRLAALDLVAKWREEGFPEPAKLLVVDGFSYLRPIEEALLDALIPSFPETVVTLAAGSSALDEELLRRGYAAQRSLWDWAKRHRPRVVFCGLDDEPFGMNRLAERLFEPQERLRTLPTVRLDPEAFVLLRPSTRREEVRTLARALRERLARDPHLSPDQIAVVLPTTGPYWGLVPEIFHEYGLPTVVHQGTPLASAPPIRRLLKLLRVILREEADWTAETIVDLLGQTAPPEPSDWRERLVVLMGTDAVPWDTLEPFSADRFLRVARAVGLTEPFQLEHWAQRVRAVFSLGESDPDEEDAPTDSMLTLQQRIAQAIRDFLTVSGFVAAAEELTDAATVPEFFAGLRQLCREYGLLETASERRPGRSDRKRAWEALSRFLRHREEDYRLLEQLFPGRVGADSGSRWAELLLRALEDPESITVPERGGEGIHLLTLPQAVGVPWKVVFLLGLSEGVLPSPGPSNFSSTPRGGQSWSGSFAASDSLPVERFLFRELLANAGWVVLSCPRLEGGRMLVPSPFLEDVRTALEPGLVPEFRSLRTREEACYFATQEVLQEMGRRHNAANAARLSPYLSLGPDGEPLPQNVERLIRMESARSSRTAWSRYDGYLDPLPQDVAAYLTERARRPWSPSQLRLFGLCPIKFFFREILGLRPIQPLEPEISPPVRGTLVHRILERFLRRRSPEGLSTVSPADRRQMHAVAQQILDPYGSVYDSLYWEVERRLLMAGLDEEDSLRGLLLSFLELEAELNVLLPGRWERGCYLEAEFSEREAAGPLLRIGDDQDALLVTGRVDRIDRQPETGYFVVFDYKIGRQPPQLGDVLDGVELQLPLYLAAARRWSGCRYPAGAVYVHLPPRRPTKERLVAFLVSDVSPPARRHRKRSRFTPEEMETILERAQHLAYQAWCHIRRGHFPVRPFDPKKAGCRYCDYAAICRWDESRQERMETSQSLFHPEPLLPEDPSEGDRQEP